MSPTARAYITSRTAGADQITSRYTTVGGTFAAFLWLSYVVSTSTNVKSVVMAAVLALTCLIAWSTFALSLFITRMTGRILRAIDFAVTPAAQ